jgi:radical SAM superfamily enzyme YgiQ (UPF0313 family)
MKALLVSLQQQSRFLKAPSWMPLYLPLLGGVLRDGGHAVAAAECFAEGASAAGSSVETAVRRFSGIVADFPPDIIIFDVNPQEWNSFRQIASAARRSAADSLILAGGQLPSLCPAETLEWRPELDAVLLGEAEQAVRMIAGGGAFRDVPGLAVRNGKEMRLTAPAIPVSDLDSLPPAARDLFDMDYHASSTPRVIPCVSVRAATVQSSRGCGGRCAFCTEGRLHHPRHRHRSAGSVIEEIETLVDRYNINGVYFLDENFLSNQERVAELCDGMARRNLPARIRWTAQVRTDTVSPGILALMREGGCLQLEYGIESGSQRILDSIGKGTSVDVNERALRITREAGIRTLAYTMYGLPGERPEDLSATEAFLERTSPDIVRFNVFSLHPGSPAVKTLEEEGVLAKDFWRNAVSLPSSDSEGFNVSDMTPRELRHGAAGIYRRQVFPRFARDYLAHNRITGIPRDFRFRSLPAFIRWKFAG